MKLHFIRSGQKRAVACVREGKEKSNGEKSEAISQTTKGKELIPLCWISTGGGKPRGGRTQLGKRGRKPAAVWTKKRSRAAFYCTSLEDCVSQIGRRNQKEGIETELILLG